uniref:Uncharacterized protein n=1 Tax=Parascaris univalens TaxID=6257 RepID=A0A915A5H5_PARUN
RVSQLEKCEADKPPVEQLMLDAGANTKRASAEYDRKEEMSVTRWAGISTFVTAVISAGEYGLHHKFHTPTMLFKKKNSIN